MQERIVKYAWEENGMYDGNVGIIAFGEICIMSAGAYCVLARHSNTECYRLSSSK
jgi:hypothetical protein